MSSSSYAYTPLSLPTSPSRRLTLLILLLPLSFLLFLLPSPFSLSTNYFPSISRLLPSSRPPTPPANPSPLLTWLYAHNLPPHPTDRPLIVTLGNKRYLPSIRNFRLRLQQWGLEPHFVVLCLDRACARDEEVRAYGFGGYVGESIAYTKFHSNLDLVTSNYTFLFLDADVYLPSPLSPLAHMRPLSDPTWDVQFQADNAWWPVHNPPLNIGWYMVRPSEGGREFVRRGMEKWVKDGGWDQGVMNDVRREMEKEESVRVSLVDPVLYKNFMLFDFKSHDWLFGHPARFTRFTQESAILHFTCIEQPLKEYFGREFAGFADSPRGYYSDPALRVLRMVGVAGWWDELRVQVGIALALATSEEEEPPRAVLWPHTVNFTWSPTDIRPLFPGVRAVSFASAQRAGFDVLEGRYLENRRALLGWEGEEGWEEGEDVWVGVAGYVDQEGRLDWPALQRAVAHLSSAPVLTLDMSGLLPPDFPASTLDAQSHSRRSHPPAISARLNRLIGHVEAVGEVVEKLEVCPMLLQGRDGGCWVCEEAAHPAAGLAGGMDEDDDNEE